jgi:hypothetical protein
MFLGYQYLQMQDISVRKRRRKKLLDSEKKKPARV